MAATDTLQYEEHRFNDDLLTNPGDIGRAEKHFPRITHVLDDPYLREIFHVHDTAAKATKKRSQKWGVVAIGMGAAAMGVAAATDLYDHAADWGVRLLGIISLGLGILSISVGWFGVLHGKAKRDWLCRRVITERLRQFHFQAFCCRLPAIISSLGGRLAEEEYRVQRRAWLDPLRDQLTLHAGAELTELLDDESETECWLHPITPTVPLQEECAEFPDWLGPYTELRIRSHSSMVEAEAGSTELSAVYREARMQLAITPDNFGRELDQVFAAYRELRIMHQLHFANFKLHDEYSIFSWTLRTHAIRLSYLLLLCTLGFFLAHYAIAVSLIFFPWISGSQTWNGASTLPFLPYLHLVVIWIAIIALAAYALQEGLQPEREIERYRQYRAAVRAIRDRFDQAPSALAKIEVMREMERLSFDEFRNFLRSMHEARFII